MEPSVHGIRSTTSDRVRRFETPSSTADQNRRQGTQQPDGHTLPKLIIFSYFKKYQAESLASEEVLPGPGTSGGRTVRPTLSHSVVPLFRTVTPQTQERPMMRGDAGRVYHVRKEDTACRRDRPGQAVFL